MLQCLCSVTVLYSTWIPSGITYHFCMPIDPFQHFFPLLLMATTIKTLEKLLIRYRRHFPANRKKNEFSRLCLHTVQGVKSINAQFPSIKLKQPLFIL